MSVGLRFIVVTDILAYGKLFFLEPWCNHKHCEPHVRSASFLILSISFMFNATNFFGNVNNFLEFLVLNNLCLDFARGIKVWREKIGPTFPTVELLNPFYATGLFLYHLKTLENWRLFDLGI